MFPTAPPRQKNRHRRQPVSCDLHNLGAKGRPAVGR